MSHANRQLGKQLTQFARGFLDGSDFIVQVENLTAPQRLSQHRLFYQRDTVLSNKGFDGEPSRRRRRDNRQIAEATQCHVKGSWDRCCGHRQYVDFRAQCLDGFLLLYPEAMLLINNQKPQIMKAEVTLQQLMGAHQNIDFSGADALDNVL